MQTTTTVPFDLPAPGIKIAVKVIDQTGHRTHGRPRRPPRPAVVLDLAKSGRSQPTTPRYDARNGHHRARASLYAAAEKAAAAVRDGLPASTGHIQLCDAIRHVLRAKGIATLIDTQVRAILPRQTTTTA